MTEDEYKKYTIQARRGIKGEAFFESLTCDHSIPHHVIGPKDLGIDYFCEWTHEDKPTGVLYAVQVKTFSDTTAKPEFVSLEEGLNYLEKHRIPNSNLRVTGKTLHYWRGLGIPVYLFAVVQAGHGDGGYQLDCYYKRFTPILTADDFPPEYDHYGGFFKVNEDSSFLAFRHPGAHGFARDLFIDHVRLCYCRGSLAYSDPHSLGLEQFRSEAVFTDLLSSYQERVCATFDRTKTLLEHLGYR